MTNAKNKTTVSVSIDKGVLRALDAFADSMGFNRSHALEFVLRHMLVGGSQFSEEVARSVGASVEVAQRARSEMLGG